MRKKKKEEEELAYPFFISFIKDDQTWIAPLPCKTKANTGNCLLKKLMYISLKGERELTLFESILLIRKMIR